MNDHPKESEDGIEEYITVINSDPSIEEVRAQIQRAKDAVARRMEERQRADSTHAEDAPMVHRPENLQSRDS